jgi:hypothetical protein
MAFGSLKSALENVKARLRADLILPIDLQIRAWQVANRKMGWGIPQDAFRHLADPPALTDEDTRAGFLGVALFFGFGDDGHGRADAVLSGHLAWEFALRRRRKKVWQCEYVHFGEPDYPHYIRLRPGAPARPQGFYYAKFNPGATYQTLAVSQLRKRLKKETGCGPEGFQFLLVTHPHVIDLMNERKAPFMALADYDVAPYGYEDFFDVPQLFCSSETLGLGIGHVDRNYPFFGIPVLRLAGRSGGQPPKGEAFLDR